MCDFYFYFLFFQNIATYEMWSDRTQERLPSIKFPRPRDDDQHHQS